MAEITLLILSQSERHDAIALFPQGPNPDPYADEPRSLLAGQANQLLNPRPDLSSVAAGKSENILQDSSVLQEVKIIDWLH